MPPYELNGNRWNWWTPTTTRSSPRTSSPSASRPRLQGRSYTPQIGLHAGPQRRLGAQVPLQSVLRRIQPARLACLEPALHRRHSGQAVRQRQDRDPRRIRPHLRPPERRRPGAGAAARPRPAARRHLRQPAQNGAAPAAAVADSGQCIPHRHGRPDGAPGCGQLRPCRSPSIPGVGPIRKPWIPMRSTRTSGRTAPTIHLHRAARNQLRTSASKWATSARFSATSTC